jgi:hypothetical protein
VVVVGFGRQGELDAQQRHVAVGMRFARHAMIVIMRVAMCVMLEGVRVLPGGRAGQQHAQRHKQSN